MLVNKPLVIDIYHGDNSSVNKPIDFAAVKDFGIVGVIHKSTEGTESVDPLYTTRRKAAVAAGLKWGAYHFFHGADVRSAQAEADDFLAASAVDADTLIALDWENVGDRQPTAPVARAFLERIEEKLGRKAVIYSGNVAKEQIKGNDAYFGSHRLWLAQYGYAWRTQASWAYPWLWQNNGDTYGPGPHRIPGIAGLVDNNTIVNNMTVDRLLAEWAA